MMFGTVTTNDGKIATNLGRAETDGDSITFQSAQLPMLSARNLLDDLLPTSVCRSAARRAPVVVCCVGMQA